MASVTLNGGTFCPSDIRKTKRKAGAELPAADGTLNIMLRGAPKHDWELIWDDITTATRASVEAIADLATSFTFVDQHGVSRTVACPIDQPYDDGIGIIAAGSPTTLYYNVTLRLKQL
jgi:hypothetical protein